MRGKAATAAISLWAWVAYSVGLHENLLANISWYATLGLLVPIIALDPPSFRSPAVMARAAPAAGLALTLALVSFNSPTPARSLVHFAKLALLLTVIYPFLLCRGRAAAAVFRAGAWAAAANALLLAAGATLLPWAAETVGDGRWRTLLNPPGALASLGGSFFGYAAYRALSARRFSLRKWALAAACALVVAADGSRAAALGLVLSAAAVGWILWGETASAKARRPPFALALAACAGALLLGSAAGVLGTGGVLDLPAAARVAPVWDFAEADSIAEYLEAVDRPRFEALAAAFEAIAAHPILGAGFESTRVAADEQDITIHNALLQAWADLGLAGFLCYALVTLSWIPRLPEALARIRLMASAEQRALYYGAITALIAYCWRDLFRGISVDPGDWILFIAPAALYWRLLLTRPRGRAAAARATAGPAAGRTRRRRGIAPAAGVAR